MRPDDFTEQMRQDADLWREVQLMRGILPPVCASDDFREPWYAYYWLRGRMMDAGVPLPFIDAAAGDIGEKAAKGSEPWAVARGWLARWEGQQAAMPNN